MLLETKIFSKRKKDKYKIAGFLYSVFKTEFGNISRIHVVFLS